MPKVEPQSDRSKSDVSTESNGGWKEAFEKLELVGTTLAICYYLWKLISALLSAGLLSAGF